MKRCQIIKLHSIILELIFNVKTTLNNMEYRKKLLKYKSFISIIWKILKSRWIML